MNLSLRAATSDDVAWLEPFYEEAMRPYVELTHVWDPNWFRVTFDPGVAWIIQFEGQDIGYLKKERRGDHVYLGDIQIAKAFRYRGIGTTLVRAILAEAATARLPVRLRVLRGNPAIVLYQRLGFVVSNELKQSFELEWKASANDAG